MILPYKESLLRTYKIIIFPSKRPLYEDKEAYMAIESDDKILSGIQATLNHEHWLREPRLIVEISDFRVIKLFLEPR